MRVLVVGMDGAHADVFERGWTPRIRALIEAGEVLPLQEDLVSRGWSEVITGEHAEVTGAVYDRPTLDGTNGWSLRFKLADIPGVGERVKPIWQALNERGFSVGIMNVPTAFPAPEVDGFFVAGGGGGGPVLQDPLPELCHPRSILPHLERHRYIVDERLNSLLADKGLYEAEDLFSRLSTMNTARTDAFLDLAQRFQIDFGFIVYKSSSNLAEFLLLPELDRATLQGDEPNPELVGAAERYYRHFDGLVERLQTAYPETQILLVSDHGMASRRWSVNPNSLLQELGYQQVSAKGRVRAEMVRHVKKLIPYKLRLAIRGQARVKAAYESMSSYDVAESRAFSKVIGDWNHGVYVNDLRRFGGPVHEADIDQIAGEIAGRINEHPDVRGHGLVARARSLPRSEGAPHFPDVVLEVPDGYMTSEEHGEIFVRFAPPQAALDINSVTRGRLLCGKSSKALAVCSSGGWRVTVEDRMDLTAVHRHILEVFTA